MTELMRQKARSGYERAEHLGLVPRFGVKPLSWNEVERDRALLDAWIEKAARVEREPLVWIRSDDPACVEFALGVLFGGTLPGTARILWSPVVFMAPPFFRVAVHDHQVEMRLATIGEVLLRGAMKHLGRPDPHWFFGTDGQAVVKAMPAAYFEARLADRDGGEKAREEVALWHRTLNTAADRIWTMSGRPTEPPTESTGLRWNEGTCDPAADIARALGKPVEDVERMLGLPPRRRGSDGETGDAG